MKELELTPFAGDKFIADRILRLKEEHDVISAVETGTYIGATFRWLYNHF